MDCPSPFLTQTLFFERYIRLMMMMRLWKIYVAQISILLTQDKQTINLRDFNLGIFHLPRLPNQSPCCIDGQFNFFQLEKLLPSFQFATNCTLIRPIEFFFICLF